MPHDNKYADVPLRIRSWGVIICIFALRDAPLFPMGEFSSP